MTEREERDQSLADPVAFVIGPIGDVGAAFGTPERAAYEKALQVLNKVIEPACQAAGLRPVRSDDITRPGEVTDQVIRLLRDADVVVADLSGANPNVMYELGLRHSIPALTIHIAERMDRLPFDISVIRTILFNRDELGLIEAREQLEAQLRAGLDEGWDPVTATRIWLQDQVGPAEPVPISAAEITDEEAPGFLDTLAEGEEALPLISESMEELTALAKELGALATDNTAKLTRSDAQGRGMKGRLAIVTEYARALDPLTVRYDTSARKLEAAVDNSGPAIVFILSRLAEDADQRTLDDGRHFLESLSLMAPKVVSAIESMRSFDAAIGGIENASRQLRPKIRLLRSAIARTIRSMDTTKDWGDSATELL